MIPTHIKLHRRSRTLELHYGEQAFEVTAELLRVYSPSAEVRGHGKGQEVLQHGKKGVGLINIEAAGNYGLRLTFDDHHDSGIYSWDYLHKLATEQDQLFADYEARLHAAGKSREADVQVVNLMPSSTKH